MLTLINVGCVATGGALGAVCRYLCTVFMLRFLGNAFPFGTLLVNVLGSTLIGGLFVYFSSKSPALGSLSLLLTVGFLGAFTTYSTFSLDTVNFILHEQYIKAFLNVLLNTMLCLTFAYVGIRFGQLFVG